MFTHAPCSRQWLGLQLMWGPGRQFNSMSRQGNIISLRLPSQLPGEQQCHEEHCNICMTIYRNVLSVISLSTPHYELRKLSTTMVIIAHAEYIYVCFDITWHYLHIELNVFLNALFVHSGTWKQENKIIIEWVTQFAADSALLSVSSFIALDIFTCCKYGGRMERCLFSVTETIIVYSCGW